MTDADDRFTRDLERPPRADTKAPPAVRAVTYSATALYHTFDVNGRHEESDRIHADTITALTDAVNELLRRHQSDPAKHDVEILTERIEPDGRSYRIHADVHTATPEINRGHVAQIIHNLHNRPTPAPQESEIF